MMSAKSSFTYMAIAAVVGVVVFNIVTEEGPYVFEDTSPVAPNWTAIESWPNAEVTDVLAQPNPNQRTTVIVLDDSGSMAGDMRAAKQAVVEALKPMAETDRVAVVALNAGVVLPFYAVGDAWDKLPQVLRRVESNGTTPLTPALRTAQALLEEEASRLRGFGTFRMIVTTDGAADDGAALSRLIKEIAATTPIQISTIGIDVSSQHVLRRADLGSFVDVANVSALASALQAAVAENTDFAAITDFSSAGE